MKNVLYIDAFSGISGNMLLGALLDLGADAEYIFGQLSKMNLGEYEIIDKRVDKCGINARYFNVKLPNMTEHTHDHHHAHEHVHCHEHGHKHHHHHGEHHHCHGHSHECHHNDHHEHNHEHCHQHHDHDVVLKHAHEHRSFSVIKEIIEHSDISDSIKERAVSVFRTLGLAEAKVHGKTLEQVHFHEVGAIDTIIDIVGCCLALESLGIEEIYVSEIKTGKGFVECAHGTMPVPAPATAELLQSGLYYDFGNIESELTTPTGAALMNVLAKSSVKIPDGFVCQKIGYGAGTKNFAIPNVLRVSLGSIDRGEYENLILAECNIDDMSGEVLVYAQEKLLVNGALDAWLTPIVMKKGRAAHKLSVLFKENDMQAVQNILLSETTTLGIRYTKVERFACERFFKEVELPQGKVNVKYGVVNGEIVNIAPEFEDCKKIAQASGVPLKKVMQDVLNIAGE